MSKKPAPYRLKPFRPLEVDEQAAVFQHAALKARTDPRWGMLFAIPNGKAASSIREAVNAKRTGLKRGVPDMFLPVPVGEWHGLFLELKRDGGTKSDLKPEQVSWIVKLQAAGYQTVVAFGWKAAVAEIAGYLESAVPYPDIDGLAHEIWAVAQLLPGEGIEDGVDRIKEVLTKNDWNKSRERSP